MNKLFVGNLPFALNEEDLKVLFERYGNVVSIKMPTDRETGRKRGFAFVEMEKADHAQDAITALDQRSVEGRHIFVSVAKPKAA